MDERSMRLAQMEASSWMRQAMRLRGVFRRRLSHRDPEERLGQPHEAFSRTGDLIHRRMMRILGPLRLQARRSEILRRHVSSWLQMAKAITQWKQRNGTDPQWSLLSLDITGDGYGRSGALSALFAPWKNFEAYAKDTHYSVPKLVKRLRSIIGKPTIENVVKFWCLPTFWSPAMLAYLREEFDMTPKEYLLALVPAVERIVETNRSATQVNSVVRAVMSGPLKWLEGKARADWGNAHTRWGRGLLQTEDVKGFALEDMDVISPVPENLTVVALRTTCGTASLLAADDTHAAAAEAWHLGSGILRGLVEQGADPSDFSDVTTDQHRPSHRAPGHRAEDLPATSRQITTILVGHRVGDILLVAVGDTLWRGRLVWDNRTRESRDPTFGWDTVAKYCGRIIIWGKYEPEAA